jgi:hypothetical protein
LVPRKVAPTAGPVLPLTHRPPRFSGLNSPILGRSVTSAHTAPGSAATSTLREIVGCTGRT